MLGVGRKPLYSSEKYKKFGILEDVIIYEGVNYKIFILANGDVYEGE